MEDQFISYGLSVKLRDLGFDEPCLAGYRDYNGIKLMTKIKDSTFPLVSDAGYGKYCHQNRHVIKSPTWGQAFDWFREEKDLLNHLTTHLNAWGEDGALETFYGYRIMFDKDGYKCEVWEQLSEYETYEEARQACLEKLIELCQKE